jgi:hypothetical protein
MLQWIVPTTTAVLGLVALALAVTLLRVRSRTEHQLASARAEAAALRTQVEEIERRLAPPAPAAASVEYVITHLGEADPEADPARVTPTIDRALFADLVLRESVVKAASLGHGLRRALAPETRNRIRFEVRREVKRARKQRRADQRAARRDWAARQRAEGADLASESAA